MTDAASRRLGRREFDQFRSRQALADHGPVTRTQAAKIELEELIEFRRRRAAKILLDEPVHFPVVFLLAVRMDVVAAVHAADVAVKSRADVIQLVKDRDELLAKGMIEEARQVERE